ncbi:MAG: CRISPR-associated endonuclease Cas1 [Bacillota bacterium]
MSTLYVTDRETELVRRGERVLVRRQGKVVADVPLVQVDQVVIFGNNSLSTPLISLFLEAQVPVSFLSFNGRFRGRLQPAFSKHAVLRQAQHRASANPTQTLELARRFVVGKIHNQRARLLRAERAGNASTADVARSLAQLIPIAERASDLDSLRGAEGLAARAYFSVMPELVGRHGFSFERRTRRPPRDPVNAMLSFSYSLLQSTVDAAVNAVGFDPYTGYLHGTRYGKPSLVLDLMEEFRPVIADAVVTALINKRMVGPSDFVERFGAVEMGDAARRAFLQAYEDKVRDEIKHPIFGYKVSLRRCVELQARILAKTLLGELERYEPFRIR